MNQKLRPQDVLVRLEGSAAGPEHKYALAVGIAALLCDGTPYQACLKVSSGRAYLSVDLPASEPRLFTLINGLSAGSFADLRPTVSFQVSRTVEHQAAQRSTWLRPEDDPDLDETLKVAAFGVEAADVMEEDMSWECQLKAILDGAANDLIEWQEPDMV